MYSGVPQNAGDPNEHLRYQSVDGDSLFVLSLSVMLSLQSPKSHNAMWPV
jgi:hypothetical protein